MRFEKRILVAIKGSGDLQAVVQRARLIAERLQAELVLMPASRSLQSQAVARTEQARQLLSAAGLAVQVRARQRRDLLADLVLSAKALECGLLIKAPDRPRGLSDALLTPRDWKLLRYAPCPVLMVKQGGSWLQRPVLAAVDAAPGDAAHGDLNPKILQLAAMIAALSDSPLELVSAYPAPMQSSDRLHQSAEQLARRYREQAQALCRQAGVSASALHIDAGPAETLIPRLAGERAAALVVLGSVARRGLSAALLGGNTAEAILERLPGDVLIVQPEASDEVLALLAASAAEAEQVP